MKRRFIILGFLILLGSFLAGCDWFGPRTLPTDVTIPTDLTTPTMVVTTTPDPATTTAPVITTTVTSAPTTTVTTTIPVVNYTVSFYNEGVLIVTRTVASGTAATAPANPTKPATEQYTYTFSGWDVDFSNVTSNLAVHATYTQTAIQFVVTFFDGEGNVVGTDTVAYGEDAEAPAPPVKTGKTFLGWDGGFTHVTSALSINALYRLDGLTNLVLLTFGEETPSAEEIEERIAFLKEVIGSEDDDEVLALLSAVLTLKNSFTTDSLAEFVDWYGNAKTLGLTRTTLINIAINLMKNRVNEGVANFDLEYYNNRIAELESEILIEQDAMDDLVNQAAAYCLLQTAEKRSACQAAVDHMISDFHFEQSYWDTHNNYHYNMYYDEWDYYVWESLTYLVDQINYYTYEEINPAEVTEYTGQFDSMIAMLSPEEEAMYLPVLDSYTAWKNHFYQYYFPSRNAILQWNDHQGGPMIDGICFTYFYPYTYSFYNQRNLQYQLEDVKREKNDRIGEHEILLLVQGYLAVPANEGKIRILLGSVYDIIDSVVLGVDEGTFNLIVGLANGTIDPQTLGLTPEDTLALVQKVSAMLKLIRSSVDEADLGNINSILDDVVVLYVNSTDKTAEEKLQMISTLQSALDFYLPALDDTYLEIIDLLDSMTLLKIQTIYAQMSVLTENELEGKTGLSVDKPSGGMIEFGLDRVKAVAILIDTVLYGGEFDIQMIVGYVLEGYFDVKFTFSNDTLKTEVQGLVQAKLTEIIALAHEIALFDMSVLSGEQIEKLMQFQSDIMWLATGVGEGFEYLPDVTLTDYNHEMFLNLIFEMFGYDMSTEKAEIIIGMFLESLECDEKTAYYTILSVMNMGMKLEEIESLDDFKAWYASLSVIGFPKEVIADVGIDILKGYVYMSDVYGEYEDAITGWENDILLFQNQILEFEGLITAKEENASLLRLQLQNLIDGLPAEAPLKALALDALYYMEEDIRLEAEFEIVQRETYNEYGWDWYYWDNDNLWTLINYQFQILQYSYGPYADFEMVETYQTNYDNYWNGLSPYQQTKYSNILATSYDRYVNRYAHFYPSLDAMVTLAGLPGQQIADQMLSVSGGIASDNRDITYYNDQICNLLSQIQWREEDIARYEENQVLFAALNAFFSNPDNLALTKDVALIFLTEFESILGNITNEDVAFIQSLIDSENPLSMLDMSALGIVGYAGELSAFLKTLGVTIDETEQAKIILLAQKVNEVRINVNPDLTTEEKAALILVWNDALAEYGAFLFDSTGYITDFLDSLTVEQVQTVIDQITVIQSLGELETEEANIARAIAISKIVMVVANNPTINPNMIIEFGINAYFDFRYQFQFTDTAYIDAEVAELQLLIQAIIDTADDVSLLPSGVLTPEQMEAVQNFHLAIEALMVYMDSGPDPVV